ncbi:MAG: hypothetical protein FWC91_01845 [Defluviitaleaceae bacterium]|nr:hypothetical protein [Defluviitaleaceae bacterium]
MKKNTYYAITNERILIINTYSNGRKKGIVTTNIANISTETVSYDKNGIGTIIFGKLPYMMHLNYGMEIFEGTSHGNIKAFFDIDNVEKVFNIYKKAKYQLKESN